MDLKLFDSVNTIEENIINNYNFTDKVIIITPTYNRRKFLPILIYQFIKQTYPKHLLSIIILDDSDVSNQDIIDNLDIEVQSRILYIYDNEKKTIGQKRNKLNDIAKSLDAKYIVCFDDDDYYPVNKISYAIYQLKRTGYLICGSSAIPIYYTQLKEIYLIGPFINRIHYGHANNGTLIYDVKYLDNNRYNDNDTQGEERYFLRNYKISLLQIPYNYTILCIAHNNNTVDKNSILNIGKRIESKFSDIINDPYLLEFYLDL